MSKPCPQLREWDQIMLSEQNVGVYKSLDIDIIVFGMCNSTSTFY